MRCGKWAVAAIAPTMKVYVSDQCNKRPRKLNGLLKKDPGSLSSDERAELIVLAEAAGVDLTGILMKTQAPGHIAAISKNGGISTSSPAVASHRGLCGG